MIFIKQVVIFLSPSLGEEKETHILSWILKKAYRTYIKSREILSITWF